MSLIVMIATALSLGCAVMSAIACGVGDPRHRIVNLVFAMLNATCFGFNLRSLLHQLQSTQLQSTAFQREEKKS